MMHHRLQTHVSRVCTILDLHAAQPGSRKAHCCIKQDLTPNVARMLAPVIRTRVAQASGARVWQNRSMPLMEYTTVLASLSHRTSVARSSI